VRNWVLTLTELLFIAQLCFVCGWVCVCGFDRLCDDLIFLSFASRILAGILRWWPFGVQMIPLANWVSVFFLRSPNTDVSHPLRLWIPNELSFDQKPTIVLLRPPSSFFGCLVVFFRFINRFYISSSSSSAVGCAPLSLCEKVRVNSTQVGSTFNGFLFPLFVIRSLPTHPPQPSYSLSLSLPRVKQVVYWVSHSIHLSTGVFEIH
jgi:hypothetical protein